MCPHPSQFPARDDQIRRTARVLEVIQQIASAPQYWTRRSLAEHHQVGERMIQKDLELIRVRLGLKLRRAEQGYLFDQLPHLPITTYAFSEALALLIAARTAQAVPGVNSAELAAAIARLESVFPVSLRPLLKEATERLPAQAEHTNRQEMLALLHRAWTERRQVEVAYASASHDGALSTRTVEPYHLLPYGRSWHLIAFDHSRQAVLLFKIDRICHAQLREGGYQIPEDFNLDDYLGDTWGVMRGAAYPTEEVELLFESQAGRWVSEETWHKSQRVEVTPDGCVRVLFHVGVTPEMVGWLLYYGAQVRVLRPDWLRVELQRRHAEACEKQHTLTEES